MAAVQTDVFAWAEPAVKHAPMPTKRARPTASDIDWTVLAPLVAHVVFTQTIATVVRVTVSYRAIELELPAAWLRNRD